MFALWRWRASNRAGLFSLLPAEGWAITGGDKFGAAVAAASAVRPTIVNLEMRMLDIWSVRSTNVTLLGAGLHKRVMTRAYYTILHLHGY
jgi:hypothetical protein